MEDTGTCWVDDLRNEGYNYIIMPKGARKKFYATKGEQLKTRPDFRDSTLFDEYMLNEGEVWPWGSDSKGVFLDINC